MELGAVIEYLNSQDCSIDDELSTDTHYVIINDVSGLAAQLVKDAVISPHTAVVLFRALKVKCHDSLEDYDAVFEMSEVQKSNNYMNRLN